MWLLFYRYRKYSEIELHIFSSFMWLWFCVFKYFWMCWHVCGSKCVCMHMRTRNYITLIHKQFLTCFFKIGLTSLQTKKMGVLLLPPPKHWNCRQKLTSWAVCLSANVLTWALMLWIFNYLHKSYELDSFICNTFQLMKFIPILTSTQ